MRFMVVSLLLLVFILRKKELLVYLFILSFPFLRIELSGISLFSIFAVLLFAVYAGEIQAVLREVDWTAYKMPLFLFTGSVIFTSVLASSKSGIMERVIFFISVFLVFLAFRAYLQTAKNFIYLWRCLVAVLLFCAAISAWQCVFGIGSVKFFFSDYNSNTDMYGYARRIPSVFEDAQQAGQYFTMMALSLCGYNMLVRQKRFWGLALFALSAGCLLLTISRMAIIAFFVGVLWTGFLKKPAAMLFLIVFLGFFCFVVKEPLYNVLPAGIQERFSSHNQARSAVFRGALWQYSLPIIFKNPLGVGLGGVNLANAGDEVGAMYPTHFTSDTRKFTHFENSYLDLLYSLGWVGLISVIWIFVAFFLYAIPYALKPGEGAYLILYLLAALLGALITPLTSPMLFQTQSALIMICLILTVDFLIRMGGSFKLEPDVLEKRLRSEGVLA